MRASVLSSVHSAQHVPNKFSAAYVQIAMASSFPDHVVQQTSQSSTRPRRSASIIQGTSEAGGGATIKHSSTTRYASLCEYHRLYSEPLNLAWKSPRRFDQPSGKIFGWHGSGKEVALGRIAAQDSKQLQGFRVFHAFGDNLESQVVREVDG